MDLSKYYIWEIIGENGTEYMIAKKDDIENTHKIPKFLGKRWKKRQDQLRNRRS